MEAVVGSMAGKVVGTLSNVAKKEISYILNCSENVEKYKREAKKLTHMKGRVQQRIDFAKSNRERLLEGVEDWVNTATTLISEATKFIDEEAATKKRWFNLRLCVNLYSLHHYGKMAIKGTSVLMQHEEDGDRDYKFSVSLPAPTQELADLFQSRNLENFDTGSTKIYQRKNLENMDTSPIQGSANLYQRKNLENIDTHKSTIKEIIQAIVDDNIQIVGITGLGGVGKTTLASEVAAEMENLFADIVFITVSQTMDVKMIKEKVLVAATRVINGAKVLFILDDVWVELKLEELGIPCGSAYMNCKILLTSRNRDVCEAMNAHKLFSVNPLKGKEAWTLFEHIVGRSEWDDTLQQIALKIVEECCGLPLFFQVVGNALKDKEIKRWEAALSQLRAPVEGDVVYNRNGIMPLKLGYDYLDDEVTKSCFLLCSMFPEDGTIGLEKLTYYGLGLGIFDNPDRVEVVVNSLKSSCLLLPGEEEELFKMNDLVRNMALIVTSKGNDKFWVQSGTGLIEWKPQKQMERYKKISLIGNKICKLLDHELIFPHLDTFLIQDNQLSTVPNEFFRGMEKLKVLDMSGNDILYLSQSVKGLKELRMLDLSRNKSLSEISVLGELTCLEILKLGGTNITEIPNEIRQLTKLRVLDLSRNEYLHEYSILGMLTCLEILKLEGCGIAKIPKEIEKLTKLKVLDLSANKLLREISVLGKLTCLEVLKLKRTRITNIPKEIGQLAKLRLLDVYSCEDLNYVSPGIVSNLINLEELYVQLSKEGNCKFLMELSELKSLKILHLLVPELHYIPEDFQFETLNEFHIQDDIIWYQTHHCKHVLQISKTSLQSMMSIMKLIQASEMLILWDIKDLDNILPDLYPEGFDELKYIELVGCDNVTSLVKTSVTLNEIGLNTKTKRKLFSQVEEIELRNLDRLELLLYSPHQDVSFCNLRKVKIQYCSSLLKLFPISVAQGLVNLRYLHISHCDSLAVVISSEDDQDKATSSAVKHDTYIVLHLTVICLHNLPKLKSFYSGYSIIKYPSLKSMVVEDCPSMKAWSHGDGHKSMLNITEDYTSINHKIIVLEEKLWAMHRDRQAREEELQAQLEADRKRVADLQVQLTKLAANLADQTRLNE